MFSAINDRSTKSNNELSVMRCGVSESVQFSEASIGV